MTETQRIITRLIDDGESDKTIAQHTGKDISYIGKLRRCWTKDRKHFVKRANVNAIYNDIAKKREAKKKEATRYAGQVNCLSCDIQFYSEDRRYNRICPRCKGQLYVSRYE